MHKEKLKLTRDEEEKGKLRKNTSSQGNDNLCTEVEDVKVISFDCQNNFILAKTSKPIVLLLETVITDLLTDHRTQDNTFCYIWRESKYAKFPAKLQLQITIGYKIPI